MRTAWIRPICLVSLAVGLTACGPNLTPQPMPTPVLPDCTPDNDGTIPAADLPIALGVTLDFFTTPSDTTRDVDQAGTGSDNVWDFDGDTSDPIVAVGPVALEDQWYASMFPSSQFVVAATYGSNGLDGIYHQDDQALWLDGTASHDQAPPAGNTLIVYSDPVAVLRFPVTVGDAYSTTATMTSPTTIDGLPFIGTDTYEVDVPGSGQLVVPDIYFDPVLRVRTLLTRTPSTGTPVISTRTTEFLFQCFGVVAQADSQPDEPDPDFTTAALVERFALGR
jgi:hypothetical protein